MKFALCWRSSMRTFAQPTAQWCKKFLLMLLCLDHTANSVEVKAFMPFQKNLAVRMTEATSGTQTHGNLNTNGPPFDQSPCQAKKKKRHFFVIEQLRLNPKPALFFLAARARLAQVPATLGQHHATATAP